jgi:hypothetical protein
VTFYLALAFPSAPPPLSARSHRQLTGPPPGPSRVRRLSRLDRVQGEPYRDVHDDGPEIERLAALQFAPVRSQPIPVSLVPSPPAPD